jgi:hypothetical protein
MRALRPMSRPTLVDQAAIKGIGIRNVRSRRFRSYHTTGVGVFSAFDTIGYKKVLIQLDTILLAIFRFSSAMLGPHVDRI